MFNWKSFDPSGCFTRTTPLWKFRFCFSDFPVGVLLFRFEGGKCFARFAWHQQSIVVKQCHYLHTDSPNWPYYHLGVISSGVLKFSVVNLWIVWLCLNGKVQSSVGRVLDSQEVSLKQLTLFDKFKVSKFYLMNFFMFQIGAQSWRSIGKVQFEKVNEKFLRTTGFIWPVVWLRTYLHFKRKNKPQSNFHIDFIETDSKKKAKKMQISFQPPERVVRICSSNQ